MRRLGFWVFASVCWLGCGSDGGSAGGGSGGSHSSDRVDLACEVVGWKPSGCRQVQVEYPALATRVAFRNLHGDLTNSDEVSIAIAPRFEPSWTVEEDSLNVTGPTFDSQGNLYLTPLLSKDGAVLVSVEGKGGVDRWRILGGDAMRGGGAAMVLRDPAQPAVEHIYVGLYERVVAVTTNGEVLWNRPTGLESAPIPPGNLDPATFGVNYVPKFDAVVGLTQDGFVYVHDRASGEALLSEPFQLPGERSPAATPIFPSDLLDDLRERLREYVEVPEEADPALLLSVLLGNDVEVANFFAVDPDRSRLWVAATAPDEDDGKPDGVSELGALYRLDLSSKGSGLGLTVGCYISFEGGSASTPAVRADGERIYVGDSSGRLIAVGPDCERVWERDVQSQILGSVAVSSDNQELYVSTVSRIIKLFDRGSESDLAWETEIDAFIPERAETNLNLNLVSIGANALAFQAGVGLLFDGVALPRDVAVGLLDRETGELRQLARGLDETVSVVSIGPVGEVYIGNSPIRRMLQQLVSASTGATAGPAIRGGVSKFGRTNLDELLIDVACVARDRALNAQSNETAGTCPESVAADLVQLEQLIAQARGAGPEAVEAGDITVTQWSGLQSVLNRAESEMRAGDLQSAADAFGTAVLVLTPEP
jgi:hypothetical protein